MKQQEFTKFNQLNKLFTEQFNSAMKKLNNENKEDLYLYFDNIYRIWYNSSLFQSGFASPAIFADIWFKNDSINVCIPRINENGFSFEWRPYATENHPFIKDLFSLVKVIENNARFKEWPYEFLQEDYSEFITEFTITDNCYISYLVEIGLEMGIIKKIPAIYISKFKATSKGINLHQLTTKAALEKVMECAAKICCRKFATLFGTSPSLNKNLIFKWIKKIEMTDDIYADLFNTVNIDIKTLWQPEYAKNNTLDDVERAALAAVYPVGKMIDRYFLTPFGRYLQIIKPVYYNPFNFEKELKYLFLDGLREDFDNTLAVFSPCSLYRITDIGKELFNCTKEEKPFALSDKELETYLDEMLKKRI